MHQSELKCWHKPVYSISSRRLAFPMPLLSSYCFMHSGPTSTASNAAQPETLSGHQSSPQARWLLRQRDSDTCILSGHPVPQQEGAPVAHNGDSLDNTPLSGFLLFSSLSDFPIILLMFLEISS